MYSNLESRSEMKSLSRNVCQTSSGTADFRPVYLRLIDQRYGLIRLIKSSSFHLLLIVSERFVPAGRHSENRRVVCLVLRPIRALPSSCTASYYFY